QIHCAILVETTCILSVPITLLFADFIEENSIMFRAWLYERHSPVLFHFMYVHQLIDFIMGSSLHRACDDMIC
ncbi:hypothetical protein HN011_008652, partial [Eciton burchellii]